MLPLHTHASINGLKNQNIFKIVDKQEFIKNNYSGDNYILIIDELDNEINNFIEKYNILGIISKKEIKNKPKKNILTITNLKKPNVINKGDVIRLKKNSTLISVLYRRGSNSNTLFVTERCNSFCLMCSQPPRDENDDWRIAELHQLIKLIDKDEEILGITGGEPTLLEDKLFDLIYNCKISLPSTSLHILTNGRKFSDIKYTNKISYINHQDIYWAVPLYSEIPSKHDYIVQSENAFNETIEGLYNLKKNNQKIEIRVVLHQLTIPRLEELSYYIFRNLPFVNHIALMGLEPMGFGKLNQNILWIDPLDYSSVLEKVVYFLHNRGLNVSLYNIPICTMPMSLWKFCRKSISDWKNTVIEECKNCPAKDDCAGFFISAGKEWRGRGIKKIDYNIYESYQNNLEI